MLPLNWLVEDTRFGLFELSAAEQFLVNTSGGVAAQFSFWCSAAYFLFLSGMLGMLINYKNFLVTMMTAEVMYLGVILSFLFYGIAFVNVQAMIYALMILIFAACESAIGLGLLIVLRRFGGGELNFDQYSDLRG